MYDLQNSQQLIEYLAEHDFRPALGGDMRTHVLAGGVSCHAVLIEGTNHGNVVLKQALPRLRVATEWLSDVGRIHCEASCMRYLHELGLHDRVPKLLWEDAAGHVIVMTEVPRPHENWKTQLLRGEVDLNLVQQWAAMLATIHRRACERRTRTSELFDDRQFFQTLRLEPYYRFSAASVPESAAFYEALIAETEATRLTLVHGDFSPKNVLICHGMPVLLDHEVAHFGDPAFDVGFAVTHLLSKALHVVEARDRMLQAASVFARTYEEGLSGVSWAAAADPRSVRHTLGCLLARVAGRSPLEYLSPDDRSRQRGIALGVMQRPPASMTELIEHWKERLA